MKVAVIGGSIGGLSAATVLHRLGCEVKVFEKSATPFKGRGGSIGYCNVPLWEEIAGRRMLRRGVQASRAQGAYVYGDLWNYWNDCLPAGTISYSQTITELGDNSLHPTIQGEPFDLAIIADGSWSALRSRYFGPSQPQYAGYNVYRFRVLKEHCPWFGAEGQYDSGRYFTILMTIAMDNGQDWLMGGTSVPAEESEITGWRVGRAGDNRQDSDPSPTGSFLYTSRNLDTWRADSSSRSWKRQRRKGKSPCCRSTNSRPARWSMAAWAWSATQRTRFRPERPRARILPFEVRRG